jgi:peroxiredoxin family protein
LLEVVVFFWFHSYKTIRKVQQYKAQLSYVGMEHK